MIRGIHGPVALETALGWVLSGPISHTESRRHLTLLTTHTLGTYCSNEELNTQLRSFWDLESLGISKTDKSVCETFSSSVKFEEGRYTVRLPWKESHPDLSSNYELSVSRLNGLLRRLHQNPDILEEYNSIIQEQISMGILEVVNQESTEGIERLHTSSCNCALQ